MRRKATFAAILVLAAFAANLDSLEVSDVSDLNEPAVRRFVAPEWPPMARMARIEGDVKVHASIEPSGEVSSVEVEYGHGMLKESATSAIRQWTFTPAATTRTVAITVHFAFEEEERNQCQRTLVTARLPYEVEVRTNPPVLETQNSQEKQKRKRK